MIVQWPQSPSYFPRSGQTSTANTNDLATISTSKDPSSFSPSLTHQHPHQQTNKSLVAWQERNGSALHKIYKPNDLPYTPIQTAPFAVCSFLAGSSDFHRCAAIEMKISPIKFTVFRHRCHNGINSKLSRAAPGMWQRKSMHIDWLLPFLKNISISFLLILLLSFFFLFLLLLLWLLGLVKKGGWLDGWRTQGRNFRGKLWALEWEGGVAVRAVLCNVVYIILLIYVWIVKCKDIWWRWVPCFLFLLWLCFFVVFITYIYIFFKSLFMAWIYR